MVPHSDDLTYLNPFSTVYTRTELEVKVRVWAMCQDNVFAKIVTGKIQADIVYQDNLVTAFRDNNPQAPTHILIVPNTIIPSADHVLPEHEAALGRMFTVAKDVAREEKLDKGYRLLVNCKEHGGQEIYHLHMHLIGGQPLGPIIAPSL